MSKELARASRALGRDMNFFGSKDRDFVIQTKGRVKINFGDKFTELFNGSKFTVGDFSVVSTIKGKPSASDSDGFYFDEDPGTLYLKIGDTIYEIFSNIKAKDGFISYKEEQDLTGEQQTLAKENIGSIFDTPEDATNSGGSGLVYIKSTNTAYILKDGVLYPITNNTEISKDYFFDKTVTIDLSEGDIALIIEGLNKYIRVGTDDNHTDISQTEDGGVIDSDKSLTIKIDGNTIINVVDGKVNIDALLEVVKGIITDEIYSSNFKKGEPSTGEGTGWGLWIDEKTGESYLQVDHIMTTTNNPPVFIRYQDALNMIKNAKVVPSKLYVMIDYQNEWEITTVENTFGENFPREGFDPQMDAKFPNLYDDGITEPIFGTDRNVRPLLLEGKSDKSFHDTVQYYYKEDSDSILDMRYDIREDNYSVIEEAGEDFDIEDQFLDFANKGRIYFARDSWNNEAPCDFKHFVNEEGKHVFNSPDNEDLSSLNTIDSIVCSNNKILDVTIRIAEEINPMIITGTRINSNTFGGSFENVTIGDPESIIEYNYFNGEIKNCNFTGTFTNNSIGCLMDTCEFKMDVINNEFNRDVKNCIFNDEVKDNIFDTSMEDCIFGKLYSNQFTGSLLKCETYNEEDLEIEYRENQIMGDFSECIWLGNVYSNDIKVDKVEKCEFKKDVIGNQIASALWQENIFEDLLAYNVFQANVVKLTAEVYVSNNHFIGRINKVSFYKDPNFDGAGINNNIINGTFDTCEIYVDFSHNTITGPVHALNINSGDKYAEQPSTFNFNTVEAASIRDITVNQDFKRNVIKAQFFTESEFNKPFECNTLTYYHQSIVCNGMSYCNGSGFSFMGTFASDMENCEFADFSRCGFRDGAIIKYAKFRNGFDNISFDTDTTIDGLELLYDEKHQVDIFYHNGSVVVSCQACASNLKGEIKMFSGAIEDIPEGWHICDGTDGTPNLVNRFIMADTTCGESTDENSMDYPFDINSTNVPSASGGTVSITIPAHTHKLKFVNVSKAKRVETGDGSGAKSYHFAGVGSIYKTDEQWDAASGSGGIVTGSRWDGEGLVSTCEAQTITATTDSSSTGTQAEGEITGDDSKVITVKKPRYYSLIFIIKM